MNLVESLASDGAPESLSVLDGSDLVRKSVKAHGVFLKTVGSTYSSARVRTRDGPAGFSNPDPLARRNPVDGIAGVLDGFPEDVCGVLDGAVLEVGVAGKLSVSAFIGFDFCHKALTRPCR